MHELSIALSVVDLATEEARRQGDVRVTAVHLRLGPMAGVLKEALLSAFGLAREGTCLERADLRIEEMPLTAYCGSCKVVRTLPSAQELSCPACGGYVLEFKSGQELDLWALEVES